MPNFKKSRGFKMKGYSYPGTSPLRENTASSIETKNAETEATVSDEAIAKGVERTKAHDVRYSEGEKNKKEKKKDEKGKIDWSSIATDAISTVVQTGAQAGIEALIRPRPNPSKNAGASGSMGGINFGTGTSLLNNKKS